MKVKDLLEKLRAMDPELPVELDAEGVFHQLVSVYVFDDEREEKIERKVLLSEGEEWVPYERRSGYTTLTDDERTELDALLKLHNLTEERRLRFVYLTDKVGGT